MDWLNTHREALITIGIVVLIFLGFLIMVWANAVEDDYRGNEKEGDAAGVSTVSLIPAITEERVKNHNDVAAERTLWEQASVNSRTTTTEVSRGKTRTVRPNHITTPLTTPVIDVWTALARCESGNNPRAISPSGRYSGAFQFSDATWRSVGGKGRAADAPYGEQLARAKLLQARSGWGQWPACARRLGLR